MIDDVKTLKRKNFSSFLYKKVQSPRLLIKIMIITCRKCHQVIGDWNSGEVTKVHNHMLRVMTSLFQTGCHENVIGVIQYQQVHFMLAYGIKGTCCGFTNVFRHLSDSRD